MFHIPDYASTNVVGVRGACEEGGGGAGGVRVLPDMIMPARVPPVRMCPQSPVAM